MFNNRQPSRWRQLSRPEGGELVDRMLQSGVPDIVLSVAEALPSEPGRWQAVVQPLLDTENPVDRLRAARLIGKTTPDAGRVVAAASRMRTSPSAKMRRERCRTSVRWSRKPISAGS